MYTITVNQSRKVWWWSYGHSALPPPIRPALLSNERCRQVGRRDIAGHKAERKTGQVKYVARRKTGQAVRQLLHIAVQGNIRKTGLWVGCVTRIRR